MKRIDIPETITDEQMSDLRRRAEQAGGDWFTPEAVARRLAADIQREMRELS